MIPLWAGPALLGSFVAVMLAMGLAISLATRGRSAGDRIRAYTVGATPSPVAAGPAARWRDALKQRQQLRRWRTLASWHQRLALQLQSADLPLRPPEYLAIRAAIGLLLGFILYLRFGLPALALPGLLVGAMLPPIWLRRRQARRRGRIEDQLPDALDLIANAVRSGQTFTRGLQLVANELPPPMSSEAASTVAELHVGVPMAEALQHMAERSELYDLELVVASVQIQHTVGGDLGEVLHNISTTVRERARIRGEVRAVTAQARISGWVIGLLPILLGAGLALINPTYMQPLFVTPIGRTLLIGAIAGWLLGFWMVRKIAAVEF